MSDQDHGFDAPADVEPSAEGVDHSLTDDVSALIDDGKTYLEAELQFQKSRVAFVAARGRAGLAYGLAAALVLHLAIVTLAIGLVLALTPLIGPWLATAAVVGVLAAGGVALALIAKRRFAGLSSAFSGGGQ